MLFIHSFIVCITWLKCVACGAAGEQVHSGMPAHMQLFHAAQQRTPPASQLHMGGRTSGLLPTQMRQARSPAAASGRGRQQRIPSDSSRSPSAQQQQQRHCEQPGQACISSSLISWVPCLYPFD